eukprot:2399133-Amphidinium_carterae.1
MLGQGLWEPWQQNSLHGRPWDSPGPAAYSADRSTLEGPRVKFGAASRMPPSSNKSKQPGPGDSIATHARAPRKNFPKPSLQYQQ